MHKDHHYTNSAIGSSPLDDEGIFATLNRKEFINNVAHEIRSPLHSILNFVFTLKNNWKSFSDSEMDECLNILSTSCNSLLHLTNTLLDISKMESGKLVKSQSLCNIVVMIQKIINDMHIIYYKKNWEIKLKYDGEISEYETILDISQISKVIRNLLFNAVKYAAEQNIEIILTLEKENTLDAILRNSNVIIQVKDYGPGILEEELENIFSLYKRSKNVNKEIEGTGLGLFMSKEVIKDHNGMIWAENNKDSSGSSFYVKLPIIHHDLLGNSLKKDLVSPANNDYSISFKEDAAIFIHERDIDARMHNSNYTPKSNGKILNTKIDNPKILFIDDDKLAILSSQIILESEGASVIPAHSQEEALKLVQNEKFDLIMLDLLLEPHCGEELIPMIKQTINSNTPIIIQTGDDDINKLNKAITNGANSYIIKPFDKNQMLKEIIKYI